jgi:hypothetical protein
VTGGTRVNWSNYETREAHLSFKEAGGALPRPCSGAAAGLQCINLQPPNAGHNLVPHKRRSLPRTVVRLGFDIRWPSAKTPARPGFRPLRDGGGCIRNNRQDS